MPAMMSRVACIAQAPGVLVRPLRSTGVPKRICTVLS